MSIELNKLVGIRTPDAIMADFTAAVKGQADIDPHVVLDEILNDVLDSVRLALMNHPTVTVTVLEDICNEVNDYLANHYMDGTES